MSAKITNSRCRLLGVVLLLSGCFVFPAFASKMVLKLQAANPSDKPQSVDLRASLPERITTNDIINLSGLNLGYDVKSDTYYVYGTLPLAPKEIAVREVELNDIWRLDENELKTLVDRSAQISDMLSSTAYSAKGSEIRSKVELGVAAVLASQAGNRITQVPPIRHIQAYESNLRGVQAIKQDVGRIENLALAAGLNPGDRLIGDDATAAAPRRDTHFPTVYGEAMIKITVMNPSQTQQQQIKLERALPPEVLIDDVIDAGGLSVRYDSKERLTYVYSDALDIGPLETKTFDVRIRDKWNVNRSRMDFLQEKINVLRLTTAGRQSLAAVDNMLRDAESRLTDAKVEVGPDSLTPAYIAFYRRQADRLDAIEHDLNRVDSALKPLETKLGFAIPAPDKKTTWLIIYSILGFLALMSLLFFFRWFVKSS